MYVNDLWKRSKQIWQSKIVNQSFNIFGCYNASGGNSVPLAEQPQSYLELDTAVRDLLTGVADSNKKRVIDTMCKFRDLIQFPKNKPTMPLIMFYFPYAYDKLIKAGNLTNNTKATLNKLNQIYGEKIDLDTKINNFIELFDRTGLFFRERYTESIDSLHDGRYSFLYVSFVPVKIQRVAETKPLNFTFWVGEHIRITFGNCTKTESTEILKVLMWLMELFPEAKNLEYDIKIFLFDVPKQFPAPGEFITPQNVNSGYTITSSTNLRKIFIYRKEEHIKVLIHEFLHSIECDFAVADERYDKEIINFVKSIKTETTPTLAPLNDNDIKDLSELERNRDAYVNPNETLAELGANILNIIHVMLRKNENFSTFERYFQKEREHALLQCARIFNHFGGITQPIKQTTNVIPYFIIRAAAYFTNEEIFNYLNVNNDICYRNPNNKKVSTALKKLGFTGYPSGFLDKIKKLMETNRSYRGQSLRMSIIE